jgi:hypothetical protein
MPLFAAKQGSAQSNPLLFIKEVAKYFMDFLETDFHRRKTPKRAIRFRNSDNLLVGISTAKYPQFNATVWKLINRTFEKGVLDHVPKGAYRAAVPENLLDLIRLQVSKISPAQVATLISSVARELENAATLYAKEYDRALSVTLEAADSSIRSGLVRPLMANIEKPLQNLELGDENAVYQMEEELVSTLVELIANKASELLRLVIGKEQPDLAAELGKVFDTTEVKTRIFAFFEAIQVGDLFLEVFEMERNQKILDKQEFYLYFCDITFNKAKYPIFYIPLTVERSGDALSFEFDAQVYVNKRALDYIVQEVNEQEQKRGTLKTTADRIIYLTQHEHDFPQIVSSILAELANVFELDRTIDVSVATSQIGRSQNVRVSNACYVTLFDKSDEALVNDYEEILQLLETGSANPLAAEFNKLIDEFINKEPTSFNGEVEEEWDGASPSDKLVFNSPIPLNSEQRQIIAALNKAGCRYITVEGPPGTGKSHTITAVVFDAILKDQSVLVLSDKKEALDVVEEKITDTMDRVRYDRHFQNPILRLGRTGSTYSQILSASSIDNIKTHHRAVKKEYENVEQEIDKLGNSLREDVEAEIIAYGDVDAREIREVQELEATINADRYPIDLAEWSKNEDGSTELEEFKSICQSLKTSLIDAPKRDAGLASALRLLRWNPEQASDLESVQGVLQAAATLCKAVDKVEASFANKLDTIRLFPGFSRDKLILLEQFLRRYQQCKGKWFGYLFKKRELEALDTQFIQHFGLASDRAPHQMLDVLQSAANVFNFMSGLPQDPARQPADLVAAIHAALVDTAIRSALATVADLDRDFTYVTADLLVNHPRTREKLGIDGRSFVGFCENRLATMPETEFNQLVRYVGLTAKINKAFASVPTVRYATQQSAIQDLVTVEMTFLLDGRVIEFYEQNRATAKALRDVIRSKQRFPKEEFAKLKKAFPCILAGIRDYAEYIPLEPEIFDLLIIDEASQVSIAQAFPALLRAKKILILGDKKQFSNIKAAQARSDTNREYLNSLEASFTTNVGRDPMRLTKLKNFNIKTSILEFFESISNYRTQLLKHFRGYKEIISYSNEYFYKNLQVMKIRGKPVDDVLKFSLLRHDGKTELEANTNGQEADYIIDELKKLKDARLSVSVGIITPHTNQQKLLIESINRLPERDYFFNELKLKIMTFDTCQGEERDVIFYSMVATRQDDRLWGVFIKDLKNVDLEEEGRIKAQRLNVGFSRAKECMHFVLSKDLTEYNGSIGEALRHYKYVLDEAHKERDITEVDAKSQMEPAVLNWFYQTSFWQEKRDRLEVIPQFEIGKYLRQLDKTYSHPAYRVDFLLVYRDDDGRDRKFVIEYDGFKEHFKELPGINTSNYQKYYSDEDVYRQKVLEGYGYRFLRLNRFNVGKDPIATFNQRLHSLLENNGDASPSIVNIHSAIEGLQNGEMKECPKCKMLRTLEEFRDSALTSGYGRFCTHCKSKPKTSMARARKEEIPVPAEYGSQPCPRCTSKMILRKGRYGKFYGCSKFPYCKGTRQVSGVVGFRK